MIPKNSNDRRKAFYTFLIFLLVSVVIIVTTVFFSIDMRSKHIRQLLEQAKSNEKEKDFSRKFANEMLALTYALDTIDKMKTPESKYPQIDGKIGALNVMIETDSAAAYNKDLYINITSMLTSLRTTKKDKIDLLNKVNNQALQTSNDKSTLEGDKNSAVSKIKRIQDLVDMYGSAGKLDPNFVKAVKDINPN
jgi:Type VI secretion system, TssO